MNDKINLAIEYYNVKKKEMMDLVNKNNKLTPDQIISIGNKLSVLEYKITALEVAKENWKRGELNINSPLFFV
mgnify:CR=1 FL=1